MVTVGTKAAGGIARWNSRPGVPPTCRSAAAMAPARESVWAGSALANERRRANACQALPAELLAGHVLRGYADDLVPLGHQPGRR
jgi:hypothetical protein